jgi:uncharacterized membrane protein YcaP (DUF421 family)
MLYDMLSMGIPPTEKIIRTVVVYVAIVVLLRLFGRRDLAQFTTFDLVVVLLLSNVVQNAIIGPDNSLTGGLLGAAILLAASWVVVRIGTSSDTAEKIFEGVPLPLVRSGSFEHKTLRRLGVRARDVDAAMREQGAQGVATVDRADLLTSGTLVIELAQGSQPASRSDIETLLARIDRLEEALVAANGRPPMPRTAAPEGPAAPAGQA